MSKVLFLDPVGGIAGDMFLAAALDAGVELDALERELAKLGALGFRLKVRRDFESTIAGLHVDVEFEGEQPHERSYLDIVAMIEASTLSRRVKNAALAVFRAIGEAEAHVHHKSLETIHFHEVGAIDSIVDICGAAICLELLGWPRCVAMPPPAGSGTVPSVHGVLPVPPPATLQVMAGRRLRASGPGERTTPTGAGLLAALFTEVDGMPDLAVERVGYGVGTKRWADAPNVLRLVLGHEARNHPSAAHVLVETNLDDASGQLVARAIEALLEAGARDAWATPVLGKKGRPAYVLAAIAAVTDQARIEEVLLRETPTLGLRTSAIERRVLDREWLEVRTPWGAVRVKVGRLGGRAVTVMPEHDDCLKLARDAGVPLRRVLDAARRAATDVEGATD
jgi:hypothetical protein